MTQKSAHAMATEYADKRNKYPGLDLFVLLYNAYFAGYQLARMREYRNLKARGLA